MYDQGAPSQSSQCCTYGMVNECAFCMCTRHASMSACDDGQKRHSFGAMRGAAIKCVSKGGINCECQKHAQKKATACTPVAIFHSMNSSSSISSNGLGGKGPPASAVSAQNT